MHFLENKLGVTAMLKYLRIAVTALSLAACALLVALWVRSYWWYDTVRCPLGSASVLIVQSRQSRLITYAGAAPITYRTGWRAISVYIGGMSYDTRPRWSYEASLDGRQIQLPHWFLSLIFATLAAIPWLPSRFSLRTLLIATTLVAVALAAIVYASR